MIRHTLDHERRGITRSLLASFAAPAVVTPNASGRDDDRAHPECKVADNRPRALHSPWHVARFENRPADAIDGSARNQELLHAVPELERDQAFLLGRPVPLTNGSSAPRPVPQVMWNRGTELP